ncbi:MAG: hypothetical protein IKN09_00380 [Clostridia bacterium]|nr:hypothetical protein [Clostridia bacterium]MBR4260523.1 hypothetical protein [Clostridia bacterium]
MPIRYNYDDMRATSQRLTALVNDFAVAYKNMASNIEWEGKAREKFDQAVEQRLATMIAMMTEVSEMPKNAANNMENKDKELAEKVRANFANLF